MNKTYDIIIIGAGASGVFAATQIDKEKSILVIDSNDKKLRKLFVSGGGRCNFTNTNASDKYYQSQNPKFCISALKQFTPQDFMTILDEEKIEYSEKHKGQMFCKETSLDIIKMLEKKLDKNVQFQMGAKVLYVLQGEDKIFKVKTSKGLFKSAVVIVASGGKSFEKLKASDIGHKIAESFDIPVVETSPALVGLASKQFTDLSGISLPVEISINKKKINDDLLFTHKGLSGPAILKASLFAEEKIMINFCPSQNIFNFLKDKQKENPKAKIEKTLAEILPKKVIPFFLKDIKTSPSPLAGEGRGEGFSEMGNISDKILQNFSNNINNYEFLIEDTLGYDTAEVTKGGVDTKHISSKTMEAKNVPNLYFIGEVLDVTGYLGGYNLQWAWSSAFACSNHILLRRL